MKIFRFWSKSSSRPARRDGRDISLSCWGWSDSSGEDARARADARLDELSRALAPGGEDYAAFLYGDTPVRERIISEHGEWRGGPLFVVTRNRLGCLVMNTPTMMFVDIDIDPGEKDILAGGGGSLIGKFFEFFSGGAPVKRPEAKPATPEERRIALLEKMAARDPDFSARIYRTPAGLRYIITHRPYDPDGAEVASVMAELGCDPLYMKLCARQHSFRARLTPKPWRCGCSNMWIPYPEDSDSMRKEYERWLIKYEAVSYRFAACSFIREIGSMKVERGFEEMIAEHDRLCRANEGLPLA